MRATGISRSVRHALVLPYSTSSVAEARRIVRKELRDEDMPAHLIEDGLAVLSELVANAVLHARPLRTGGIRLEWRAERDQFHVEVTDGGGQEAPRLRASNPMATWGRGLIIVAALSRDWGVVPRPGGVTVHATVRA